VIDWDLIEMKRVVPQPRKPKKVQVEDIAWDSVLKEDAKMTTRESKRMYQNDWSFIRE
jgi:hypothetical protein